MVCFLAEGPVRLAWVKGKLNELLSTKWILLQSTQELRRDTFQQYNDPKAVAILEAIYLLHIVLKLTAGHLQVLQSPVALVTF